MARRSPCPRRPQKPTASKIPLSSLCQEVSFGKKFFQRSLSQKIGGLPYLC